LGLAFFTLPIDYKTTLHNQIWEMVHFGNGFNWTEVYTMPIHLRKFYFKKLVDIKKKEADEMKAAQSKSKAGKVRMR
jgi:hypothetical protein